DVVEGRRVDAAQLGAVADRGAGFAGAGGWSDLEVSIGERAARGDEDRGVGRDLPGVAAADLDQRGDADLAGERAGRAVQHRRDRLDPADRRAGDDERRVVVQAGAVAE